MIIPKTKISLFYLLGLLNSKLLNFYFRSLYGTTHMAGGYLRFNGSYLKELPIYVSRNKKVMAVIDTFAKYIYTLKFMIISAVIKKEEGAIIHLIFELKELLNISIYELYFKEKFAEDGLYPEPKEYLLEAVSKHLKPINYDRWAELYWKAQLEGNLTEEEQKELEKLEKEDMKTIEEVYKALKEDVKIKELIEKIKSHRWVKVIEGEV